MDIDRFWSLVESARSTATTGGEPFDEVLADLLTRLPPREILAYAERFDARGGPAASPARGPARQSAAQSAIGR